MQIKSSLQTLGFSRRLPADFWTLWGSGRTDRLWKVLGAKHSSPSSWQCVLRHTLVFSVLVSHLQNEDKTHLLDLAVERAK